MKSENTFSNAIEQVMLHNGFYAPLSLIYKEFGKYREKSGLTPDKTIQERVQRDKRFTKIGLGVYALTEYLDKLPKEAEIRTPTIEQKNKRMHTHMQGMLIEIGNMKGFETYTPDKNGIFINRELGKISTLQILPSFTYPHIINDSIKFIDVVWINERGFPSQLFEVENSTDFRGGFTKFCELQDFRTDFAFVAPAEKIAKFDTEKKKVAFAEVAGRCSFFTYNYIQERYESTLNAKKFQ